MSDTQKNPRKKQQTKQNDISAQFDEFKPQEEAKTGNALGAVIRFFITVVVIFVMAWCLRMFIFSPYEIPSGSMEETIQIGDMVFSEKVSYQILGGTPQYKDIITFKDPSKADRTLIKRVIATEGQTVDLKDGQVIVDGTALDEPYVSSNKKSFPLPAPSVEIEYPYQVPTGCVWVMGDNRTESSDSRYFGAIPVDSVTGHANFRYWPLNRAGVLS